jgi:hypothetical protein
MAKDLGASNHTVREWLVKHGIHVGRYLSSKEHVHHINRKKDDDRIENLMLCDAKTHGKLHAREDGPNDGQFKKGNIPWNAKNPK